MKFSEVLGWISCDFKLCWLQVISLSLFLPYNMTDQKLVLRTGEMSPLSFSCCLLLLTLLALFSISAACTFCGELVQLKLDNIYSVNPLKQGCITFHM